MSYRAAGSLPRHPRRFSRPALLVAATIMAFASTFAHAEELIPLGATWRYLDDGSDQGTAWREPDFDDAGWQSGPAELGFGDGDEATVIDSGAITFYFRHSFTADSSGAVALEVNLRRDDGAVVYLNGTEIVRSNMPSGTVGYQTRALIATDDGDGLHEYSVPADSLTSGRNVLAVEVHQNNPGSSDVSFDLRLDKRAESDEVSVVRGPYLQLGTPSSMIVRWRTDGPTDTKLSYGRRVGSLNTRIGSEEPTREHEVLITGLDSSTKYFYEIGNADATFAGNDADHFFKTSPRVGSWEPLRVWVIGDSGECSASQDGCVEAAAVMNEYLDWAAANGERLADIVLMLGDNAYVNATDRETTRGLFEPFAKVLRNHVLWPVPGNHEFGASDSPTQTGPYYEAFTLPKAGEAGGIASGTEAYYSYDYGNVHFVALDSHDTSREAPNNPDTNICPGDGSGGAMYNWLCEDLAATTQDFIVSYWHHPPYSKGSHDSDSPSESTMRHMRERFVPMLEHYGADLNLTGHSHSYERSVLIDGHYGVSALYRRGVHGKDITRGGPASGGYRKDPGANQGSIYSVVGSSSKNQGGLSRHPIMVYWENIEGSVVLDFRGDQMDAHFIRNDGAVNDRYRLTKNVEEDDQGDTVEIGHTGRTASSLLGIGPPEI
ncbi:MAG: metallophosphoesterase family protein, partial [Gammaproteobacteria bacterium]|nr:metallophosphoesterase family protein [Gammaproteobacteria bacterium]